jgi:hypothetical protein
MARQVSEGKTNVYWCTAIASKTAPTVAEITAGTAIVGFTTKDGIQVNINGNKVDSATLAETFDAQVVGSWGADVSLKLFRDNTADTAWNLAVYGANGFLVIDRFRNSGTLPSVGNKVEVWPAQMGQPAPGNTATNEVMTFELPFAITSIPSLTATVA